MVYFLLYLFFEVLLSVNISSYLGGLLTFSEILLSAFLGAFILMNFRSTLMENMSSVMNRSIDVGQFQRLNLFTIMGAVLLVIPGFLTDLIGILMQFSVFTSMIVNRYNVKSKNNNEFRENENLKKDMDVIDVEIISDDATSK